MSEPNVWAESWSIVDVLRVARLSLVVAFALIFAGPCAAQVVVLTVGPNGSHQTIQGALSSLVNGWVNDVRIEAGTYQENVVIELPSVSLSSGDVVISGGWNATFTAQTADPSLTVIDGDSAGSCLRVAPTASDIIEIFISNLTLANGQAEAGGGLYFNTTGDVHLELTNVAVTDNRADATTGPSAGGGLYASISGSRNRLAVYDSSFTGNVAGPLAGAIQARGGGAYVDISGVSPADFQGVTFTGNVVDAGGGEDGAGLYLLVGSGSVGWVYDCVFVANEAQATTGGPTVGGVGVFLYGADTAWVRVRRLTLLDNISFTGVGEQFFYWGNGTSSFRAGDILAAGGDNGVRLDGHHNAEVSMTNLTATGHTAKGLFVWQFDPTAVMSLHNSVLYGNGVDLDVIGTLAASNNLIGVDPLFTDPIAGNYRLGVGSPAENAGTNSPPAELGDADCGGGLRVIDGIVDIGAYEGVGLLFSDGFELRNSNRWAETVGTSG